MNKTHMIILVVGLGGCLALTMMMGHLLKMSPDMRTGGKARTRFAQRFGPMLAEPPQLLIGPAGGPAGGARVTVKLVPRPTADLDRLILQISDFVWAEEFDEGPVQALTLKWRDPVTGEPSRMVLQRPPRRPGARLFGSSGRPSKVPPEPGVK